VRNINLEAKWKSKGKTKTKIKHSLFAKKDCLKCYEGWWTRVDNFSRLNFPKKQVLSIFLARLSKGMD